MRRGVFENHLGGTLTAEKKLQVPLSIGASKIAGHSSKASKRRLFYVLLLSVVCFHSIIFPWIVTSFSVSERHDWPVSTDSERSTGPSDGSFNGYPVQLRQGIPFHSSVHCVGETHNPDTAWMYRSCEFTNLCLDIQTKEFFVVESQTEQELQKHPIPQAYVSTQLSSPNNTAGSTNLTVALGGINPRWLGKDFNQGIQKVKWFPKRVPVPPSQYYELDSNVVLVPFHSFAAHNVGHMLWDDFLPIFNLLQIFGWSHLIETFASSLPRKLHLLLLRVDTLPLLYGTCEMRRKKAKQCAENFEKFLPLLGVDPQTFSTLKSVQWQPKDDASPASIVCAKHAMAGLGMLTDHGLKDHGWLMPKETHSVQNTGKGALLYQFRNALLRNLDLPILPPSRTAVGSPIQLVLSAHSSGDPPRDVHFLNQQKVLAQAFPQLAIQHVELSKMGLREQVELVSQTNIFVSTCGGGSMTATFLPKGASLILYYNEDGGYDFANNFNLTGDPAFLDWDLFNNMAYLRVHWLPIGSMNTREGWETLALLIRHELEVMESGL
jgi:hypothetical protein